MGCPGSLGAACLPKLALGLIRSAAANCSFAAQIRSGHGAGSDVGLTREREAFSDCRDCPCGPAHSRLPFPLLTALLYLRPFYTRDTFVLSISYTSLPKHPPKHLILLVERDASPFDVAQGRRLRSA